MQKFLNKEHACFIQFFRNPLWALALFIFLAASVSMTATVFLCDTLTYLQQSILLQLGIISCLFIAVFLVIPICMRLILNCLFKVRRIGTGLKNLPLSYNIHLQKPAPPNSPAPRWALKSFRQTMAQPGTRLSSKTYS